MKKATIKSLICQNCFENIPNSFFVNSTIKNIGFNWCLQGESVNGICPKCNQQTLFYIADNQLANIATIFYKLGYKIFQTRDGEALFDSFDYTSSTTFFIPYIGFECNEYNNIPITEEFLQDLNAIAAKYNWNISGGLVNIIDGNLDHQIFNTVDDIKKYPDYSVWRVGIGLDYNYIRNYIDANIINTLNTSGINFKSLHEKDRYINEEVCKFFGYKCQELYNALSTEFFDKWRTIICQELSMMTDQ